jgi:hypothetical protein
VIRGFRDYMSTASDEVSAQTVSFTMPQDEHLPAELHNKACTIVAGVYAGDPDDLTLATAPRAARGGR